ncbi:TonB-dependent receptor [Algibacillus agarilyticus]|uniref:TonB-dependent receptor n=1 Tax=Algibacillus agarilyticus TaxID=2234133 RepID=UPI000DCF806B|nr:TonB-dependent receptor [Algibacillus agarilyticus]
MSVVNRQTKKSYHSVFFSGIAGMAMAVSSPTLLAQEVNSALGEEETEVIEVTGVRGALENALNTKREAVSIVDAISSADIDALPALDFGEALQALPGVQLDRSNEGRTSEISLRGLSGGFVKTTAFGQSFATPSRSSGPTGGTNPFASFEAGVFDGVTLIKSPTADIQAGGMAGVVDKKLQQALAKKDGKYSVSLGGRLEELTGNWDKTIKFSAAKHLIKDELAVAVKFSGSEQTFRRDLMQTTVYTSLDETNTQGDMISNTIGDYKAAWGLPADAVVKGVANGRNVTEYSEGDRVSFTGNIEWKPSENLKLGSHVLYTERDLGDGTKEDTAFFAGLHHNTPAKASSKRHYYSANVEPDMATAPFIYKHDAAGNPEYIASKVNFTDGGLQFTNRKTTFLETAKGIMLYADYAKDDWVLDGIVSYSEAENQFMNIGIDFRHTQHHNPATNFTPDGGVRASYPSVPTGIDGTISTGQGNTADTIVTATGWDNYNYNNLNWQKPGYTGGTVSSNDPSNGGRRLQFTVDGRVDNPTREMSAAEFNAERILQLDLADEFSIGSIKFGVRTSTEELDNRDQKIGIVGIDTDAINEGFIHDNIISEQQTAFFDGAIPGTFGAGSGWRTFDNDFISNELSKGLADLTAVTDDNPYALTIASPSVFYDRLNNGTKLPNFFANNFSAEQTITAAYLMSDFSGEIGSVYYSGNFGVRHEKTENKFLGKVAKQLPSKVYVPDDFPFESDYSNTLPSMNLSVELTDDIIVRTAYYKALVRPNLRAQNPSLTIKESNNSLTIDLPKGELEPYTADNFDLSFEWYNREGSAISVGLFQKEITGLFLQEKPCPSLGEYTFIDEQFGAFEGEDSESSGNCIQTETFTNPDTGEVTNRNVTVNRSFNADNEIKLQGVEFAAQQKLDFLPYPWNGFGGVFNYTYIKQTGDEGDNKLYKVSPRSYNLIGYWEDDNFSVRLAYNWRDSFDIRKSSQYYGIEDRRTKASGRLDLSSSYKIAQGLKVHLKAYNLTDEQVYEYFGEDERAVARIDYTGRIFELGVNYSF